MYDYHYNTIKKQYKDRAVLMFTDTDSLTYEIKTDDIYKDMEKDKNLYDFSEYPENHPLYGICNKKVIGKFKDETGDKIIKRFVGVRSKVYAIETETPITLKLEESKKLKGIPKSRFRKADDIKRLQGMRIRKQR